MRLAPFGRGESNLSGAPIVEAKAPTATPTTGGGERTGRARRAGRRMGRAQVYAELNDFIDLGAFSVTGANFRGGRLAWCGADEGCEIWDGGARNAEVGAEIVEEGDFEFLAGFGEAEHCVARLATFSLTVPPEILRLVTKARMSFSEALVLSGMSVRSSTRKSSSLRPSRRFNRRSRGRSRFGA